MSAPMPITKTPREPVPLVDAADGLGDFAAAASIEEARPEVVLPETTVGLDALDAFGQEPGQVPPPDVIAGRAGTEVTKAHPSPFDRMKPARAAVVCFVLVAAADWLQQPAAPPTAVEPSAPAITIADVQDHVGLEPPRAAVATPPVVRRLAAQAAPSGWPTTERERRSAPAPSAQPLAVRSMPAVTSPAASLAGAAPTPSPRDVRAIDGLAGALETAAEKTALMAAARTPSAASVSTAALTADAGSPAGAALPVAGVPSVVAAPSAAALPPAGTSPGTSLDVSLHAVAAPRGRELEARAIENVLGRYRNAFNRLDAGAALAVWPTVNEKTLARAFERLEDQDVSFERCQIEIAAVLAEAACSGSARYVPKVGSRTPKAEARQWTFSLRKASGAWLIDRVDAR